MAFSAVSKTRSGSTYKAFATAIATTFAFEEALLESVTRERVEDRSDPFVDSPSAPSLPSPEPCSFPPVPAVDLTPPPLPDSLPPAIPSSSVTRTSPAPLAPSRRLSPAKKERMKQQSKVRRKIQRRAKQDALGQPAPTSSKLFAKIAQKSSPVTVPAVLEAFEVAKGSFVGRKASFAPKVYLLKQLVGLDSLNFRLIRWDGITPKRIMDESRRIVAVLAGQPSGAGWLEVIFRATACMEDARLRGHFSADDVDHSRGKFPTLASGFAHGGGRKEPLPQKPRDPVNASLVDELLVAFERIASFQSHVLAAWHPRIYTYFLKMVQAFMGHPSGLVRNWVNSVYSSAVWNLGPQTACYKHLDFANLPFGLCAVTALGSFDPTRSGHIILWRLNLVIEFPSGSTALIPSAVVPHGNTPVQLNETRYSFTQYCSGGLFRWSERGMQGDRAFFDNLAEKDLVASNEQDAQRWGFGLSLFTTEQELEQRVKD